MQYAVDELRQRNRKLRAELTAGQLDQAAARLFGAIRALPEFINADKIAAYLAVDGEISLKPVIDHALALGKKIYLPNLDLKLLRFSPFFHGQKMRTNRFRLPEPDVADDAMLPPALLDLVLTPLVAFDAQCNRIGMGGGYYDRCFEFRKQPGRNKPILIGVAHELQKTELLEPKAWDVRLDMVVSDAATYRHC